MNVYRIEVTFEDNRKKMEFVAAKDELKAMDIVVEHYKNKQIIDIKVV